MNKDTGVPILNTKLNVNDCLFAMYEIKKAENPESEPEIVNLSKFVERGKEGIVSKLKKYIQDNSVIYRNTISCYSHFEKGDKIASRYSQKGVGGGIRPFHELPIVIGNTPNRGLRPDIIFSPLSLTSRATPGLPIEMLMGLYGTMTNQQIDASAFTVNIERIRQIQGEMVGMGFNPDFLETCIDPMTKRKFKVYVGICSIRILEHTSREKLKACSQINHSTNKLTRQVTKGGPYSGLRQGTMELDVLGAHSASSLKHQLYNTQSDRIVIALCSQCGHINDRLGLLSQSVVQNLEGKKCSRCGEESLVSTNTVYALFRIYCHLLSAGFRLAPFPS